ncbi:hypothetical protein DIS24_g11729 [Lasiodiplodia hormozganensis]|uniref:Uncharacterized protein n=2 Tax=Botryosphaeriaceae TaxID=45131 RepID=A0AA40BVQ9_9PEZI|nr:hypothetical protein DIS24_g11729 [Lasiodiplodia hormozganensis]
MDPRNSSYIHQSGFRPIYSGGVPSHNSTPGPYFHSAPSSQHASLHPAAASPVSSNKRTASSALGTGNGDPAGGGGSAAKKEKKLKGKWTEEEEKLLIKLRSSGMKWVDISQQNPGRSATACRLRYQNYTEKKEWAEDEKDMLARLYHRFMEDMWKRIADEMCRPWRSCERMHWQLGEEEMLRRANVQYRGASAGGGGPTPPGGHLDDENASPPSSTLAADDDNNTTSPASSYHHMSTHSPHQRAHHHHHPHAQHPYNHQHSPYAAAPNHHHHNLSREPSRERGDQQWPPPPPLLPTRPTSGASTAASVGQPASPQQLPPLPRAGAATAQHQHQSSGLPLHQPAATGAYHLATPLLGTPRQTPTPVSSSAGGSGVGGGSTGGGMRPVTPLSLAAATAGGGGDGQQQHQQVQRGPTPSSLGTTPRTVPTVVHEGSGGVAAPGRLASPFAGGESRMTVIGRDEGGGVGKRRHQTAGFVADMDVVRVKKEATTGSDD